MTLSASVEGLLRADSAARRAGSWAGREATASALRSCRGARAGLRRAAAAAAAASELLREAGAAPPPVRSPVRSRPSESGGGAGGLGVLGRRKHPEAGGVRKGQAEKGHEGTPEN